MALIRQFWDIFFVCIEFERRRLPVGQKYIVVPQSGKASFFSIIQEYSTCHSSAGRDESAKR